jgi:type II secretion system protein H
MFKFCAGAKRGHAASRSGTRERFGAGRNAHAFRYARGFTLIEMLLVLALIGVFTTLFVINADSLTRETATQAVEAKFWTAVREARSQAILHRRAQALWFDKKAAAFVVENVETGAKRSFVIKRDDWAPDTRLEVALQKQVDSNQHTMVAGELKTLKEIPEARFFPDGACTPFVATFNVGGEEKEIELDPWTGAELLKRDNER